MPFPENIHFHIKPQHIDDMVQKLPIPKGNIRRSRVRIGEFKDKLLALPIDKLKKWRLKPAIQELLPYLATERSHKELHKRVLSISIAAMDDLSIHCIVRLMYSFFDSREFCISAKKRLNGSQLPAWLIPLEILDGTHLPLQLAEKICANKIPIHTALTELELPSWSPLGIESISAIPKFWSADYLQELPAKETLDWIRHSSGSVHTRNALLKALIRRYGVSIPNPSFIQADTPLGDLFRAAMSLWIYPGKMWDKLPSEAKEAAKWIHCQALLKKHLSAADASFWETYLTEIVDILWLRTERLLVIRFESTLIIQSRTGMWCHQPESDFNLWKNRLWQVNQALPPHILLEAMPDNLKERIDFLDAWREK
jgi:hypothetical protein